jgi:hypothetical protein
MPRNEPKNPTSEEATAAADPVAEAAAAEAADAESGAEAEAQSGNGEAKTKRQKTPIPDGFVAPVDFAKRLDKHLNQPDGTTKPQVIYGYVKNSKTFPSQERGADDFPRFIVNLEEGLKWFDEKLTKDAEKAKAKAAKETAAASSESK